jgi:hypothetical protein
VECKDQRLEIRLPQQQLTDIDDIIASVDSGFKPTRSDVVRSFIAQGIDRHLGRVVQVQDTIPLGQRISLFFQICQQQQMAYDKSGKPVPLLERRFNNNNSKQNITAEALVRLVYLQRMFWFFELDRSSLAAFDANLTSDEILSLMQPEPGQDVCGEVAQVALTLKMFRELDAVRQKADQDSHHTDVQDNLGVLKHYVTRHRIPLKFGGYPESWGRHNQIAALMQWIDAGNAGNYTCEGYGGYIRTQHNDDPDAGRQYALMVQVYEDIVRHRRKLDLEGLMAMVQDRRLDFSGMD